MNKYRVYSVPFVPFLDFGPRLTYLNWPLANRPKKPYNIAIWWYLTRVHRRDNKVLDRPMSLVFTRLFGRLGLICYY